MKKKKNILFWGMIIFCLTFSSLSCSSGGGSSSDDPINDMVNTPTDDPSTDPTDEDNTKTPQTLTAPATPSKPVVVSADSQITVSWDSVNNTTSYELWLSTDDNVDSATLNKDNITDATIIITNLQNGVPVYVWLKAVNDHGTSDFSEMANGLPLAPTAAPSAPSAPILTAGDALINTGWTAVEGATSYELWYNTDNNSATATQFGGNITALSQMITELTNGTIYYVWVKAKNSIGTSAFSLSANATPKTGTPVAPVETSLELIQAEDMTESGQYAGLMDNPFNGMTLYANGDAIEANFNFPTVPGYYRLDITGASNNTNNAQASVTLDSAVIGSINYTETDPAVNSVSFTVSEGIPGERNLKITRINDTGISNLYIDEVELFFLGEPIPLPDAPVAADEPVFTSRQYRNMFVEWGKTEAQVQARIDDMVGKFFYGEDGGEWQIYKEVGSDMAYIHTVDTNDVRSEGMSYGMMVALQLDMKEEFDKLWNWTKTYMQHQIGDRAGYFAWQVGINGNIMDQNPAPDGEEYFALALFFAANRWGNGTGIYNYEAEANDILDDMIRHKQKRGLTSWNGSAENMIDQNAKQIVLSTIGQSASYTNPSYHLPHFYELFHRMADPSLRTLWANGEDADGDIPARQGITWLEMADVSRQHFRDATHTITGLAPAYSNFDGTPNGSNPGVQSDKFSYDSWRVGANIAQDYLWFKSDEWQKDTWVKRYLGFFHDEGVSSHGNLFELDGRQISGDHSPGLVAMNAVAAMIYEDQKAWKFIEELWNITPTKGTYRYYDGCLYLFGMLNVSGNYRIYDGNE